MPALWIVEQLDIIEHILAGVLPCFVYLSPDTLGLERGEETLGDSIIIEVVLVSCTIFRPC